MAKGDENVPRLVRAAEALEAELANLEALSAAVGEVRLDSEKHLARAAKDLERALELPERLATGLAAFAGAIQEMQARQQAALEPLAARAAEIQERRRRLEAHMETFALLGSAAADATALLQTERERSLVLEDLKSKVGEIARSARELFEAARSDDFPDVAREADALSKRMTAIRRRLESASPSAD